ncbi:PAS domain S-box-containing protein [Microbacterium sp. AG790]|uniref:PAS domain S-box protein n=1 Tax=Microbacterium sp. AG790 TaxID=2183995 RepID=UPI000EAE6AC0|nr:PAS domain-containing sensor histidine kinase [Microbacterium sp. AG790]RKS93622.1 PAS domain S-box-containing protein [Microbacterium sp. AG790]
MTSPQPSAGPSRGLPPHWEHQIGRVAIVKLSGDGAVIDWNEGAEHIKGWTQDEILGQNFSVFYRDEDRRRGLPGYLLSRAREDGSVEDAGWRVRRDGREFWAHVTISAIRGDDAEVVGFVKLTRDITADKQREDERAAHQRSVAHELLSPVTALNGYIEMIGDALAEQTRLLRHVARATENIVEMAKEMSSSVDARDAPFAPHRIFVDDVVRGAASLVLPGAAGNRVVYGRLDRGPVLGDEFALRRAIAHVIENAAKYSDDVLRLDVVDADRTVTIRVQDRGRGIHPDDMQRVLLDGERGRYADVDDGGTGDGLADAVRVVRQHRGRVELSRADDGGTIAEIILPHDPRG